MSSAIFGYPLANSPLVGGPGGTKYTVAMFDHDWKVTEANLASALWGVGAGVIKYPDTTSFTVTAGAGLTLNIAAGRAIAVHSTTGPAGIVSNGTIVLTTANGVTASTTKNLFLTQETSVKDGRPGFLWTDSSTTSVDGAVYLAQVVAGAGSITSVTMNPDRFAELKIHSYTEDTTPDPTDEILIWDSATGSLMKVTVANLLASNGGVTGPASSVTNNIPAFGNNTGKTLVDSDFKFDDLGAPRTITQNAHGFAVGDHLYISAVNTYAKAKADALATTNPVGRVIAATTNTFVVSRNGYLTGLSGLTAGALYYLSPSTAGAMTTTMPTASGQYIRPVFYADSTTSGYVLDRMAVPTPSDFTQATYTTNTNLLGTEDRCDMDNTSGITLTLPTPTAALYKKHRITIPNISTSGTCYVNITGGLAFHDGSTSIPVAWGSTAEVYVGKRADNTYLWVIV